MEDMLQSKELHKKKNVNDVLREDVQRGRIDFFGQATWLFMSSG